MPPTPRPTARPTAGPVHEDLTDIGDFLAVPEAEQLEHDDVVDEEISTDQLVVDFADVPDGDVVDLEALEAEHAGEQDGSSW